MKWSAVGGAVEYIVRWREPSGGSYTYSWVNATEYEYSWLDISRTYEWWVSARNDYAIGADSDVWTFYTPAQAFGEPSREMLDKADMVIDENGNWYLSPRMEK